MDKPNPTATRAINDAVMKTIGILKLNSSTLVTLRYCVLKDHSDGVTTIGFLERRYPFIAVELTRQDALESIKGAVR